MRLELYGDVSSFSYWGEPTITLNAIKAQVEAMPAYDTNIDMIIHSNGGEVLEALAIYDYLRTSGKKISALLMGGAHSAAIVLLLAGERGYRRCTAQNTSFLHNVQSFAGGSPKDIASALIDGLTLEQRIASIYAKRTGMSIEKAQEVLDSSRLYSAKEMKELGFIDEIVNYNTNFFNRKNMIDIKQLLEQAKNLIAHNNKALDKVVNYDYTDQEGKLLFTTESEDDTLAVNDTVSMAEGVSDSGEYVLSDGRHVELENAVVNSITTASDDESADESDANAVEIANLKDSLDKANELIKALRSALASNYKPQEGGYQPTPSVNGSKQPQSTVDEVKAKLALLGKK